VGFRLANACPITQPLSRPLEPTKIDDNLKENVSMVRIRLRRIGLKGQPSYRLVAADKEFPRDGRFLEILGFYNPRTDPATLNIKEDRIYYWMQNGALPTESVGQIFKSAGVLDRFERFKKGETVETLLGEAAEAASKHMAPVKTRKD
jgi:small subunit ribosomal protein S16